MKKTNKVLKTLILLGSVSFLFIGCDPKATEIPEPLAPEVTTQNVTSITANSAQCGGNVITDNDSTVTVRGICWSTNQEPTIADNKTTDGAGLGEFESVISGLLENTTYYVRAYASNSVGTGYGDVVSFVTEDSPIDANIEQGTMTDQEGTVYKTVKLGTQTWMAQNLKTSTYNDGTTIPSVTDANQWDALTTGAYCYHNNDESNNDKIGKLYNWYAVETGKICPTGWHVPTQTEWATLETFLKENNFGAGGTDNIAKALAANSDWTYSDVANVVGNDLTINNRTGFNALPSGSRSFSGNFLNVSNYTFFWTSTLKDADYAYYSGLYYYESTLQNLNDNKSYGFSIRCVKDNN